MINDLIMYVVSGALGGLASSLLWAESWEEFKSYVSLRTLILGPIGGYLYYIAHTEWNLPNGVMAFVAGYAFKDFVEGLLNRFKVGGRSGENR